MANLIAVKGDKNSHGNGDLLIGSTDVFMNNKEVVTETTNASPDSLCPLPPHGNPQTSSYSSTVFINNKRVHRINDQRTCGAVTVKTNNITVFGD